MRSLVAVLAVASLACGATNDAEQARQIDYLLEKQALLEARLDQMQGLAGRRLEIPSEETKVIIAEHIGNSTDARAQEAMTLLLSAFNDVSVCLDYVWLLLCGSLVMFMQAGFAILEAGACRQSNAGLLLMKNCFDACVSAVVWYVLGYGLAYGASGNAFIGTSLFAGTGFDGASSHDHRDWFFQWAFCATAATIVSGAVAERIQFVGYVLFAVVMTGLIYPVIVHWTWSSEGWLVTMGYSDFAGSGIVHLTGGVAALVGSSLVGPRYGRWKKENENAFAPHNMSLVVLGTFILWFGWYGFNCGSTLGFSSIETARTAALVAMNSTLSAAAGGLTMLVLRYRTRSLDLGGICNGILAGLVAVCAGVNDMNPGFALLTGFLAALAHEAGHVLLVALGVDDPLDAFAVHGCGGMVGVLVRPLFSMSGASGKLFGTHCLGLVCIAAWSGLLSAAVFLPLKFAGHLTSSKQSQIQGHDRKLAQPAYHDDSVTVLASEPYGSAEASGHADQNI